jgi:hypothetical protein
VSLKETIALFVLKRELGAVAKGKYGQEAKTMWQKLIAFMNGKKLYTGIALVTLPTVTAAVGKAILDNGGDPLLAAKVVSWGAGSVLIVVGAIHKLVKWLDDQTPDADAQ